MGMALKLGDQQNQAPPWVGVGWSTTCLGRKKLRTRLCHILQRCRTKQHCLNVHVPACHVCAQIYLQKHVKQSPYDPFSSQSRPQSLGHSHAPVGGERMLARTVSTPSMLSPTHSKLKRKGKCIGEQWHLLSKCLFQDCEYMDSPSHVSTIQVHSRCTHNQA